MGRMRRAPEFWAVAAMAVLALGCGRSRSRRAAEDDPPGPDRGKADLLCTPHEFLACGDGVAVYCDAAGFDTVEVACGSAGCDPAANGCGCAPKSVSCENDVFVRCGEEGRIVEASSCPVGCNPSPEAEAECQRMIVANATHAGIGCDYDIEGDYAPSADDVIDTDDDGQCDTVHAQFDGPPICVRVYERVVIPEGVTVRVVGSRSLLLMALRRVVLDGVLDVSAEATAGGPGSVAHGRGASGSGSAGGGGAGHNTPGAPGGSGGANGGRAGASYGLASIIPLLGGSPGGEGGGGAAGGGGGGAIQVASCGTFAMGSGGVIDASGGGGAGGAGANGGMPRGGAGGGSGGSILIEAARVKVASGAMIVANGGGGGGGGGLDARNGASGAKGDRIPAGARGGAGGGAGGSGGAGGARDGAPVGGSEAGAYAGGGGGGGAAGRLRINVRPDTVPSIGEALISPNPAIYGVGIAP